MAYYFDKDNKQISVKRWRKLSDDPFYTVIREYENDKHYARTYWLGVASDPRTKPEERRIFVTDIYNITHTNYNGEPLETPLKTRDSSFGGRYASIDSAVNAYEDFLVRHAGCEWLPREDGSTIFVEHGNKIVPPEPPKPPSADEPSVAPAETSSDADDIAGSW